MAMNLAQFRYFLAVAETGSFTQAAERVHVTQPTLSTGIRRLEQELGGPLFERGRAVALTAAGRRFLPHARTVVQEIGAARTEMRAAPAPTALRLGLLRGLPAAPLARLLADFALAHPEVALEFAEAASPALAQRLARRQIDLALTELPADARREAALPLLRQRYVLFVPASHPLAGRAVCRLADLADLRFVLGPESAASRSARQTLEAQGLRPRVAGRVEDEARALALVAAGLGVTLLPDSFRLAGTVAVRLADLDLSRRLGLVWRADAPEPAAQFRAFAAGHDWLAPPRRRARAELDAAH